MSKNNLSYYLFAYFYPIIMMIYYLILRGINLNNVVGLPLYAFLSIMAIIIAYRSRNLPFVKLINLFLCYSILSVFFYFFNDVPLSCYTDTFRSFVFPIVFAYLGCVYSKDNSFNKWYLVACGFCFVVGIYLYITAPEYYVNHVANARDSGITDDADKLAGYVRFYSFFSTSYAISCLSVPSFILSCTYILKKEYVINRYLLFIVALVSFISALLCLQRIAMACSVLLLLFFIIIAVIRFKPQRINYPLLICVIFVVVILFPIFFEQLEWYERVSFVITDKFESDMSLSKAMSQRTDQIYTFDRSTVFSTLFGLGLGSCGHAAHYAGLDAITDIEYMKLFYEFGLLGMSLFGFIIVSTLIRGIKRIKYLLGEVLILLYYLAAGIGSDSLTFFIFSVMFWYTLGRIWNTEYLNTLIQKK